MPDSGWSRLRICSGPAHPMSSGMHFLQMEVKLKVLLLLHCSYTITACDSFGCSTLKRPFGKLKCLMDFNIDDCHHLEDLPKEIRGLVNFQCLTLGWCF
ncbi:hypothetical protein EUGRSUZ_L00533 [Eucalyptus grandis]|uniref:Leucine-rich repeat-containing N-terminal plant-type domain-containing protein n=1 Tax=Eucalyptus grandis TaxID=71139 RepID=A0A058ZWD8_EUCGR|nr:hypothetical protein EUGRSUZ_L00533 [Eucalyptus grandis]